MKEYLNIIGGYQPAQKRLKDRKKRVLSFEDIRHYQKVIVALMETERIMRGDRCGGGDVMRQLRCDIYASRAV